jgi:hypothetical protein
MHIVIDLMGGDETVITAVTDEDPHAAAKIEEAKRRFLEEMFKRAPQPALQIVPIEG